MRFTNAEIRAFCHIQGYDGTWDENRGPAEIETAEDYEPSKSFQRKMFAEFDRRKLGKKEG